jgi:hypothetical protein
MTTAAQVNGIVPAPQIEQISISRNLHTSQSVQHAPVGITKPRAMASRPNSESF